MVASRKGAVTTSSGRLFQSAVVQGEKRHLPVCSCVGGLVISTGTGSSGIFCGLVGSWSVFGVDVEELWWYL